MSRLLLLAQRIPKRDEKRAKRKQTSCCICSFCVLRHELVFQRVAWPNMVKRPSKGISISSPSQDYQLSNWIAEPVNTASCVLMILLPLLFLAMHKASSRISSQCHYRLRRKIRKERLAKGFTEFETCFEDCFKCFKMCASLSLSLSRMVEGVFLWVPVAAGNWRSYHNRLHGSRHRNW